MQGSIKKYQLEELEAGLSFSFERELKRSDIEQFCELTADYHPLHSNPSYAKEHGFKDIIAHGALITSFSSSLIGMKLPGENALVLSQSFQYNKPCYPGDILSFRAELVAIDKRFRTIEVKVKVLNQDDMKLASGSWKVMLRKAK